MPLKFKYGAKDEVPTEHLGLYVEGDGAFVLDAEGAVEKSKVDEFRTNNVALKRQLDSLTARYEGIDPDAVKQLLAESGGTMRVLTKTISKVTVSDGLLTVKLETNAGQTLLNGLEIIPSGLARDSLPTLARVPGRL